MAHATVQQYQTFSHPADLPDNVEQLLDDASDDIDTLISETPGHTDPDPENPEHVAAVMNATCAQAQLKAQTYSGAAVVMLTMAGVLPPPQ